jgi:hypothetical protein
MIKVYITHCSHFANKTDRYWIADNSNSKLIHIGVCDIDYSFMSLLVTSLNAKLVTLDMPDEEFKKLMLEEGYEQ